jgi:hypothetical protein
MSGLLISDRAMVSRRRQLREVEQLGAAFPDRGALDPEVAAVDVQVLQHRQLAVEGVVLRNHAEARAYRRAMRLRVHPEHGQHPARSR